MMMYHSPVLLDDSVKGLNIIPNGTYVDATYGGGGHSREIIKKKPILRIYGNNYDTKDGSCIRDFVHVSDIAEIHYKVLEKINKSNVSKILNCGYNKGVSVFEVANSFKKQSRKKVEILVSEKRKGDLAKIIASNNKLKKFIKWKPKFNNLNTIVKSCINWEKRQ